MKNFSDNQFSITTLPRETCPLLHTITTTPEDAYTLAATTLKWSGKLPEHDHAEPHQIDLLSATVITKH